MALTKVTGSGIEDGTLSVDDIANDAVTADKLANSINTDIATGVTGNTTANAALPKAGGAMTGAITTTSTFDGRDVATDGAKLDAIEASADVTDTTNVTAAGALMDSELAGLAAVKATTGTFLTADQTKLDGIEALADVTDITNVTAAGALMDSEVTNLAQVKAFDTTDYATSTQGTTADNALPKAGGTMTGALTNRYSEIVERRYGSTIPRLVTTAGNAGNVAGQASPFTSGWSMGFTTSNTHVESVSSGTVWTSRSASSQELLTLMGRSGVQHFNGNFNIHQVTALRTLNTSGHTFPYQQVKSAGPKGTTTHGAFVKHISGRVPWGWWCSGLVAGGGWQFCYSNTLGSSNMGYNHTHPYTDTNTDNVPTVLLVALPGSVDRYIDSPTEWSLFST